MSKPITFSDEVYEDLTRLARDEGVEVQDILKRALGLLLWALEVRDEGGRIIAERDGGKDTQLVWWKSRDCRGG